MQLNTSASSSDSGAATAQTLHVAATTVTTTRACEVFMMSPCRLKLGSVTQNKKLRLR